MSVEQARVDAHAALMADLQRSLLATREDAHARRKLAHASHAHGMADEQDARFWAADHLLTQLLALPAPTVPEDPEPGQGDILELVEEERPSSPGLSTGWGRTPHRGGW